MKYRGLEILLHIVYLAVGIIIPMIFQYSYDKIKIIVRLEKLNEHE